MGSKSSPTAGGFLDPVGVLRGAGPITVARLAPRNLAVVADLLSFLPRGYDDYRAVYGLDALVALPTGTRVVVTGRVRRVHVFPRRLLDVYIEAHGAHLRARWFRPPPGMAKGFGKGQEVMFAGVLRRRDDGGVELVQPMNVTARLAGGTDLSSGLGIRPRYPMIKGVPGRTIEKLVRGALEHCRPHIVDPLGAAVLKRWDMAPLKDALDAVHCPNPSMDAGILASLQTGQAPAHRRLAFEDLMMIQLGQLRGRFQARTSSGWRCTADAQYVRAGLHKALPFLLTTEQDQAINTVYDDLCGDHPMQRLISGDVGSGKTVVALAAALAVARSGAQTMMMAPTEILAEQHAATFAQWGREVGLRAGLLTGGMPRHERANVLGAAACGEVDVLVGTLALANPEVRVPRLALAVIDEQQRFGVRQRALFRRTSDAGILPHLLVLTATPIPRTLALALYGDLDLTTIGGLPPGRKPVATRLCEGESGRREAYRAITQAVARGEQAFAVCPAVEDNEDINAVSVADRFLALKRLGLKVAAIHGQMEPREQNHIMRAFRDGAIDVLVGTTVVEVGLDIPRATVMVIEDADRFGLAQLHQLRGRVGRGQRPGSCWLSTRARDEDALHRLRMLAATNDGFAVAEEDLRQRGPGEAFGVRQTGVTASPLLRVPGAWALVEAAREEAGRVLKSDPGLALPGHQRWRIILEHRAAENATLDFEAGG